MIIFLKMNGGKKKSLSDMDLPRVLLPAAPAVYPEVGEGRGVPAPVPG